MSLASCADLFIEFRTNQLVRFLSVKTFNAIKGKCRAGTIWENMTLVRIIPCNCISKSRKILSAVIFKYGKITVVPETSDN